MSIKKKKRSRKKLNIEKTLEKYEKRIREGPLYNQLAELQDAYLSTFRMFCTERNIRKFNTNNAFLLMKMCKEKNIFVKGVTSECKAKGVYRAKLLDGDTRDTSKNF